MLHCKWSQNRAVILKNCSFWLVPNLCHSNMSPPSIWITGACHYIWKITAPFSTPWHRCYYKTTLQFTDVLTMLLTKNIDLCIVWFVLLPHDVLQPYERNHLHLKIALILLDDINLNPKLFNKHQIKDHKFDVFNMKKLSFIHFKINRLLHTID